MSVLDIKNVRKSFKGLEVLKGVSFEVEQGDVVAIIGSSGSGKSTLLRCLIGLETISDGTILMDGEPIVQDGIYNKQNKVNMTAEGKMGMVFQQFNLFPHLTVKKNLELAPKIVKKLGQTDIETDSEYYLAKVGLLDKKEAYPKELSGGQKQRVAIARALMMKPEVLLFDEPTSALDPELTKEVLATIKKLTMENMTMIVVTHEMEFAREVANKIYFMDDGIILEHGSPDEIFINPKNQRTKEFLGNIIKTDVTQSADKI